MAASTRKVLVTAGPTREHIDPVRFITNASSGRMGYAVAAEAVAAGHEVTLLSGPLELPPPAGVELVRFESVAELHAALEARFEACDALVMAAAVGDFTVAERRQEKIRRQDGPITLELVPTPDLLAEVCRRRRDNQIIIAFAVADAEAEPAAQSEAQKKLIPKQADYIVVNPPAAMSADISRAAILSREGVVADWSERPKADLARRIVALLGR